MQSSETLLQLVLLAQAQEVFLAVAFIFMALWFVLKLATDRLRNQQPPQQRVPPRPPARPEARPVARQPGQARDPREEVAEFLRRAQARRETDKPPAALKPKRQAPAERRRPAREQQRRESLANRGAKAQDPAAALILETNESSRAPRAIGGLSGDLSQRHIEPHLRDPYLQSIGSLSASDSTVTGTAQTTVDSMAEVPTSASEFAQMLSDGNKLRDAIVLSEILRRPTDRW